MNTDEYLKFAAQVYKEAAHLLGLSVDDIMIVMNVPEIIQAELDAGENAADVARRLVDDEAIS